MRVGGMHKFISNILDSAHPPSIHSFTGSKLMGPKKVSFKEDKAKAAKRPAPKKYKVKIAQSPAGGEAADPFIKKKKQRVDPSKAAAATVPLPQDGHGANGFF